LQGVTAFTDVLRSTRKTWHICQPGLTGSVVQFLLSTADEHQTKFQSATI